MATYKILVPSGIGDFSWTWSKLVTTNDQFHIEYIGGKPDRMFAFLSLLPREKVLSFAPNGNYYTKWNGQGELICLSRNPRMYPEILKMKRYADLARNKTMFVESNTHLEAGNRLETWIQNEILNVDFHYKILGTLDKCVRGNYFIVNYSSYGTKKAWGYYNVPEAADTVQHIVEQTGWTPLFVGGAYDDFTIDIHVEVLNRDIPAISLVGRTTDLIVVIALIQQAQMYFGACSGLMAISNVLNIPVLTYYPPFLKPPGRKLAGTWHDKKVPYGSLFWEGKDKDINAINGFLDKLTVS